ncbi:MAG: hypothetical protein NVSMB59_03780 [Vulcanimicrobiaceae bacterium]
MHCFRSATVPLGVAFVAALGAHVAIDLGGDVVLARDSFDGIAHASRGVVAFGALAALLIAGGAALAAAVREARGSEDAFCRAVRAAMPTDVRAFVAIVMLAAPCLVAAMGLMDASLAGHAASLDDALGGSLLFGTATTAAIAAVASAAAWFGMRRFARTHRAIVRFLISFLRVEATCVGLARARRARRSRLVWGEAARARRVRDRAPPTHASLVRS